MTEFEKRFVRRPAFRTCSKYHQTLLSKCLFEHGTLAQIALVASSSPFLRNSSLGPQLCSLISFENSKTDLLTTVFDPVCVETIQFMFHLNINVMMFEESGQWLRDMSTKTRYFRHSLTHLTLTSVREYDLLPVLQCGLVALQQLTLRYSIEFCPETIEILNDQEVRMPRLEKVNLRFQYRYGDEDIAAVRRVKKLHSLEFNSCPIGGGLSNEGGFSLFESDHDDDCDDTFANLRVLKLIAPNGLPLPDDRSVAHISQNLNVRANLENFFIKGHAFTTTVLDSFLSSLSSPNFTTLHLDYLPKIRIDSLLSSANLAAVEDTSSSAASQPRYSFAATLTCLTIALDIGFTDDCLLAIGKHLPLLRRLEIEQAFSITFDLVTNCGIVLDEPTKQSLFPSLESLKLCTILHFEIKGLEVLTAILGKTLREFILNSTTTFGLAPSVFYTDATFLSCLESLTKLEALEWNDSFVPLFQFEKNISLAWRSNIRALSMSFRETPMYSEKQRWKEYEAIYKVFPLCNLVVTKEIDPCKGLSQMDYYDGCEADFALDYDDDDDDDEDDDE